mmetsp:Transcript_20270/g.30747  ORF Transcript_20270/g.30747 Transcript_20270/m.30747 type:complete len:203 (+) Transcript_20270:59-667(+)
MKLITILLSNIFSPALALSFGQNRVFVGTPVTQNRSLVSDCMTPLSKLVTLTELSTVDEAMHLLLAMDVSGACVIQKDSGSLVGIVSTFDFLQQEAGDGALLPFEGSFEDVRHDLELVKKICATKVGDLMTTDPVTMQINDTMRNAATLMSHENLHRLPIMDKDRLVGLLTSTDVMMDMVRVVKSLPHATEESSNLPGNSRP